MIRSQDRRITARFGVTIAEPPGDSITRSLIDTATTSRCRRITRSFGHTVAGFPDRSVTERSHHLNTPSPRH
jgi:hypothetical protein